MGRRAKYLTLEAKLTAAKCHKASYCQSERQVFQLGKITRKAQNARAYVKHRGRRGPRTTISELPDSLTSSLLQFATLPLPDSYLFHQSCAGSDLIDESDLSQWDQPPPYDHPVPPDSPEEARFTENLVDVMHGRREKLPGFLWRFERRRRGWLQPGTGFVFVSPTCMNAQDISSWPIVTCRG
ncbi:hypothetical protein DEU56DRAFT_919353 [Suillus clintonianus]|uniref:uncharacterized protein n=1 Tax=Suillus clintonianus TaxID=1904413 RepID=UPI001B886BFA|nr:uncharacterized protein DEU56DRAFT_919353 [Suillus clintonianus]KAG2115639.1 hypothetical protein DEU56DRAFT_919353 [Suillus clintonianus]